MSGWNWALMALSGQCGSEMVGIDLVHGMIGPYSGEIVEKSENDMDPPKSEGKIDPVLKVYYEAQPG